MATSMIFHLILIITFVLYIIFHRKVSTLFSKLFRKLFNQADGTIRDLKKGKVLKLIGLTLWMSWPIIGIISGANIIPQSVVLFTFPLVILGTFFFWFGGKLTIQQASKGIWSEKPFLLFLRSFEMQSKVWDLNQHESILTDNFNKKINFISIGDNTEVFQREGTKRIYVDPKAWQERVAFLMEKASYIVVIYYPTTGVEWELDQILETGYLNKTIFYFPVIKRKTAIEHYTSLRVKLKDYSNRELPSELSISPRLPQFLAFKDGNFYFLKPTGTLYKISLFLPRLKRNSVVSMCSKLSVIRTKLKCGISVNLKITLFYGIITLIILYVFFLAILVLILIFMIIIFQSMTFS